MSVIESLLGEIFHDPVKRKANKTKNLRLLAKRVCRGTGSKEVMVKITGFCKGTGHVKAHIDYISKHGKIELENESEAKYKGKEVKEFSNDWKSDIDNYKRYKNQRDSVSIMLSMRKGVDSSSVKNAVREFAQKTFGENHKYGFVLHTHQNNPHCHLAVQCKGFDGKRLNPRKADLQHWREGFAEALQHEGVEATATPRRSRGVVKKAQRSALWHIEKGNEKRKPRITKVHAKKVKEAINEIDLEAHNKPWEEKILERQSKIRHAWLTVADLIEQGKNTITFKGKEAKNERPDYNRFRNERPGPRAASLYQSNIKKPGLRTPSESFTGLRNVSDVGMVHNERPFEMFLRKDALNSLGRTRTTDTEMRRSRDINNAVDNGRMNPKKGGNQLFADDIRNFVRNMPEMRTERHEIISELRQKFTKQSEKTNHKVKDNEYQSPEL